MNAGDSDQHGADTGHDSGDAAEQVVEEPESANYDVVLAISVLESHSDG